MVYEFNVLLMSSRIHSTELLTIKSPQKSIRRDFTNNKARIRKMCAHTYTAVETIFGFNTDNV